MNKRCYNFGILLLGLMFFYLVVVKNINLECVFKKLFDISCPGCGLTRCFRAILKGNFSSAFRYSIIGIPLFIFGFIYVLLLVRDIIVNDNLGNRLLYMVFKKYYMVIIILLGISMIINNIMGI